MSDYEKMKDIASEFADGVADSGSNPGKWFASRDAYLAALLSVSDFNTKIFEALEWSGRDDECPYCRLVHECI